MMVCSFFDLVTQNIKLFSQFFKKVLWKVLPTLPFCGNISTTKITGEITMNNKIKLIVTDDASEFTQENLNIFTK